MTDTAKQINDSENAKLFRSRMDIFVLNALNEKDGQGYGYDVVTYIQERTKGHYKIKSVSTIYNILKRLETAGYVSSMKGGNESNGAARVYYALTPEGKEYLERDKKEWQYLRTLLDNLVSDESFDLDNDQPPYSASVLKPFTRRNRESSPDASMTSFSDESDDSSSYYDYSADDNDSLPPESNDETEVNLSEPEEVQPFDDSLETSSCEEEEEPLNVEIEQVSASLAPSSDPDTTNNSAKEDDFERLFAEYKAKQFGEQKPTSVHSFSFTQNSNDTPGRESVVFAAKPAEKIEEKAIVVPGREPTYEGSTRELGETDSGSTDDFDGNNNVIREVNFTPVSPFIDKLKKDLEAEGYSLHTFTDKAKVGAVRYFFINRIFRDATIATFFYLIVTLLASHLFQNIFGISLMTMHITAGVGFLFTLISLMTMHITAGVGFLFTLISFCVCMSNPKKKIKATVRLRLINATLFLVFLVLAMGFVVYYLFTSRYTLTSTHMYTPAFILTTIPFFGIMYSILYGSGKYFLR